jgi:hypothetical protein
MHVIHYLIYKLRFYFVFVLFFGTFIILAGGLPLYFLWGSIGLGIFLLIFHFLVWTKPYMVTSEYTPQDEADGSFVKYENHRETARNLGVSFYDYTDKKGKKQTKMLNRPNMYYRGKKIR